ncbi:hypothetical protein DLM75_21210 [Leptospira stimsonii]|uniref:Uncharacterized protein n=1 Tax=Leptospira stimsonii TaxID=2202203 RepID=A0A396YSC1_9LEPT|nr:hypothetical protein DLM75_21210 [Leptospira stimsonii]
MKTSISRSFPWSNKKSKADLLDERAVGNQGTDAEIGRISLFLRRRVGKRVSNGRNSTENGMK